MSASTESIRQAEQEIMYRTFDDRLYKLFDCYCDIDNQDNKDDYYKVMNEAFNLIIKIRGEDILL